MNRRQRLLGIVVLVLLFSVPVGYVAVLWLAVDSLSTRVLSVAEHQPGYEVVRVEVRNDASYPVYLYLAWGVYETGGPPPSGAIDLKGFRGLQVLKPGETYVDGGTLVKRRPGSSYAYHYQWDPQVLQEAREVWSKFRAHFPRQVRGYWGFDKVGRRGQALITLPEEP